MCLKCNNRIYALNINGIKSSFTVTFLPNGRSAILQVKLETLGRQGKPVRVAVLEEVVVRLEREPELPHEVGQHQENHGEAQVLADAAAPSGLQRKKKGTSVFIVPQPVLS